MNSWYSAPRTNETGLELWVSDGTAEGTRLLLDIREGSASSFPSEFEVLNNELFFRANDGVHGDELWKTDGTELGTVLIKDIFAGPVLSYPNELTAFNGSVFFAASDGLNGSELWKTDGTETGTILVKDINVGTGRSSPNRFFVSGSYLYFVADDGVHGDELWKTDGTEVGTQLVKDINPTGDGFGFRFRADTSDEFKDMVNLDGNLLFVAQDASNNLELWTTDGTEEGTTLVKDIGAEGSFFGPLELTKLNEQNIVFCSK